MGVHIILSNPCTQHAAFSFLIFLLLHCTACEQKLITMNQFSKVTVRRNKRREDSKHMRILCRTPDKHRNHAASSHLNHKISINQESHTSTKCESPHIIMFAMCTCLFLHSTELWWVLKSKIIKNTSNCCAANPANSSPICRDMLDQKRPVCL